MCSHVAVEALGVLTPRPGSGTRRRSPVRLRGRVRFAVAAGLVAAASGCGATHGPEPRPTEAQTREAYFDTPLIRRDAAQAIPLGVTRAGLRDALGGVSAIELVDARGRDCVVFPLGGTESRDRFGSPVAAEVWFCFGADGRLVQKRWYSATAR